MTQDPLTLATHNHAHCIAMHKAVRGKAGFEREQAHWHYWSNHHQRELEMLRRAITMREDHGTQ